MSEKCNVAAHFAAYQKGEISKEKMMAYLLDANEEGAIDDATYQRYADEISADVFSDNDVAVVG